MNRDDCRGHLCQHGGKCLDGVNTYSCDCPVNWTGEYCGQDVDECATSQPCQNHGTCQNTEGGYECICVKGFEGVNCELNCCQLLSQNGGTCHDKVGRYEREIQLLQEENIALKIRVEDLEMMVDKGMSENNSQ